MFHVATVFALAAALAGVVLAAVRAHARGRVAPVLLLALGVAPVAGLYLYSQDLRAVSSHGFLHTSILYRLLNVGFPPDCPLLAGEPLLYPWAHHALAGGLTRTLEVSPGWAFAALNVAALAGTLVFAYRLGAFVGGTRPTAALAATLSVYGTTFLNYTHVLQPLHDLTGLSAFGLRNPVVVKKFSNLNSNSLGYLFFAMALYAATRMFAGPAAQRSRGDALVLAAGVAGAAFFYPLSWAGIGLCLAGMAGVALWRSGAESLPMILRAALVSIGASVVASPYLYAIAAGKAQQMFVVAPDLEFLLNKLLGAALTVAPPCLLLWWRRTAVVRVLQNRSDGLLYVAAAALTMLLAYVVLGTHWNTNEYKFLGMACFATGIVAAVGLADFAEVSRAGAFAVLASFLLPAGADIEWKATHRSFVLADPYVEDGSVLRHANPNEDALYGWLREETAPGAVVVDDRLTAPVFAQRALYVGLDFRGVAASRDIEDGWHIAPDVILDTYYAYPLELTRRRTRIAEALLFGTGPSASPEALEALYSDAAGATVLLIARDPAARRRFDHTPELERVFATPAAWVYELAP